MEQTITKEDALEYIKQNIGRCNLSSFNVGATYVDDAKQNLVLYSSFVGMLSQRK